MKTNLISNFVGANTSRSFSGFIVIVSFLIFFPVTIFATSSISSNASERRFIRQVENIEKVYQRHVDKLLEADSLINTGSSIREKTSTEIRQANLHMLDCAKKYNNERKELDKKLKDVKGAEANEVRLAIRNLDAQYREELKAYDNIMQQVVRESELATSSYVLGKRYKKEARKGIRETSKRLEDLRSNISKDADTKEDVVAK